MATMMAVRYHEDMTIMILKKLFSTIHNVDNTYDKDNVKSNAASKKVKDDDNDIRNKDKMNGVILIEMKCQKMTA